MAGDFHLQTEGLGGFKAVREAFDAAFRCFEGNAAQVTPGMHVSKKDYLLFFNDLQGIAPELISAISPDFYPDGDAVAAARKALEL